jgi:hypothetical protein
MAMRNVMRNTTLALILLALAACTGTPRRDEPPVASGRFTHPRFGWSIDIPVGFGAFPIRAESINGETGVLVSNFEVEEPWSLAEFRDFPSDGAALRFWSLEGIIGAPLPNDDSQLPLDLSVLDETTRYVGMSEPRPLFGTAHGDGHPYAVAVWFGPNVSDEDRVAIKSALRSVEFRPTNPDTVIDHRLIVLGPADDYSVGSVTRFDRDDLPLDGVFADYEGEFTFYLVRGPSGSYAITTDFLGNGIKCDLQVLRQPLTYECPAEGWRWDRFGNVLEAGAPWPDGTSHLLILPTPRSWDGNLMLDPFGNAPEEADEAWG